MDRKNVETKYKKSEDRVMIKWLDMIQPIPEISPLHSRTNSFHTHTRTRFMCIHFVILFTGFAVSKSLILLSFALMLPEMVALFVSIDTERLDTYCGHPFHFLLRFHLFHYLRVNFSLTLLAAFQSRYISLLGSIPSVSSLQFSSY